MFSVRTAGASVKTWTGQPRSRGPCVARLVWAACATRCAEVSDVVSEAPRDVSAARADRVEELTLARRAPRGAVDRHDAEVVDRDAGGSPG